MYGTDWLAHNDFVLFFTPEEEALLSICHPFHFLHHQNILLFMLRQRYMHIMLIWYALCYWCISFSHSVVYNSCMRKTTWLFLILFLRVAQYLSFCMHTCTCLYTLCIISWCKAVIVPTKSHVCDIVWFTAVYGKGFILMQFFFQVYKSFDIL